MLMLTESNNPLIIDQPEDALDISTIFKDLVKPIKNKKLQRQFIFSSHNSALVIGGDSDNIFILKANSKKSEIESSGEIEKKNVREKLIINLEGGEGLYTLKSKKYGYSNRK